MQGGRASSQMFPEYSAGSKALDALNMNLFVYSLADGGTADPDTAIDRPRIIFLPPTSCLI